VLELSAIDLDALGEALEDHSDFIHWFVDPVTGEVMAWSEDMDEPSPEEGDARLVEPIPSFEAYEDMRDFVARVPDRRAADGLARAIEGRGAFRRFKDTLYELPDLREKWFAFHDLRMRRRAISWLQGNRLVDDVSAAAALAVLDDPPVGEGVVDPFEVAARVAADLRVIFGDRLVDVVVFGSYAQGTATNDSDLDVALVLREVVDAWTDARTADEVLWRHTLDSGITVSALVVDTAEWETPSRPLAVTARASGRSVV
jgi:predicted nucleotidyltransferase